MNEKEDKAMSTSENSSNSVRKSSKEKFVSSKETASFMNDEDAITIEMKIFRIVISVMLVITGSINTLAAKWADEIVINGRKFNHPFFQATVMFVGEICCLAAYLLVHIIERFRWKRRHRNSAVREGEQKSQQTDEAIVGKNNVENNKVFSEEDVTWHDDVSEYPTIPRFNYLLFAAPAFCDVCATSVQYVGLTLTSASSYQMLRDVSRKYCHTKSAAASLVFLSVDTAGRSYCCDQCNASPDDQVSVTGKKLWIGMCFVVIGLVIVGVADIIFSHDTEGMNKTSILAGDLLIVFSQIVVALQMVVEQKLLADYDCPALLAVGLEGVFGFIILTILMVPMYYIHVPEMFSNSPERRLEDALDALNEISNSGELTGALFLLIASIAFFNFSGVSVTKYMNATTRMVMDSVRTVVIWAVSIPLFHSHFIPLQLLGFAFLILGMFVYNDVIIGPLLRKTKCGAVLYSTSRVHVERF